MVPVPRGVFTSLLKVGIHENAIEFEELYFRQKFGRAMGSPLSPVMVGHFTECFESEVLPTITYLPPLWIRFVVQTKTILQIFFPGLWSNWRRKKGSCFWIQ